MNIRENLAKINTEIPAGVILVAVSKMNTTEAILDAYHSGQLIFGENKAQELQAKHGVLPADIKWHFIGHLQTNKVRYIAPFINLIESIDSLRILEETDREGSRNNRIINCLLQFHIATEETKFGLDLPETEKILTSESYSRMKHIALCGVMGMASFTKDETLIRKEFRILNGYFHYLKQRFFRERIEFREISMGMSGDFRIAIEEGSTIVRIGSAIFGER